MTISEDAEETLAAKFAVIRELLDERRWRVYLGTEARAVGRGLFRPIYPNRTVCVTELLQKVTLLVGSPVPLLRP